MVEQVSNAGDGHVGRWEASQYLSVHGIVALARKHVRDARGPVGFHDRENTELVVDQDVPVYGFK